MKTLLTIVICSTVVGLGFGAGLAFLQLRPVEPLSELASIAESESPAPLSAPLSDKLQPQAEVLETVFEFGTIELGATRSHDFKISNTGTSPLSIKVASTTCKCTVGSLVTNEVLPGESTEVNLEWIAKPRPGPFRHGAVLATNDPKQSQIELMVEGTIVASTFALSPTELIYGTVQVGLSKDAEVLLLSYVDQEVEILGHEIQGDDMNGNVDIRFTTIAKKDLPNTEVFSGIKISSTFKAGNAIGAMRGSLKLLTNLRNAEQLSVPISSHVVGDISIYGPGWRPKHSLLRMGNVRGTKGKTVKLVLAVRGEHAPTTEFEVASIDPPELKVSVGERRKMTDQLYHFPLLVSVPAGTKPLVRLGPPASTDAKIVLKSTHPDTPEVRIGVHFSVGL